MSDKLEAYRSGTGPIPEEYRAWELYGAGMDKLGQGDGPVSLALPKPGPTEMLARVDALGLCFSDIKIINLGGDHPRLGGRDLSQEPLVLGHEVSVTVVEVGEALQERFHVGQRFVVQADVFHKGKNVSYGYGIRGGAAQYTMLTEALYAGDAGSYLVPVREETGYSEAALTEPWACVERAYHIRFRDKLKPRGLTWIIGLGGADLGNYTLGEDIDSNKAWPRKVIMTEVIGPVASALRRISLMTGLPIEETAPLAHMLPIMLQRKNVAFDDIILLGEPRSGVVDRLSQLLAKDGHLALVYPDPTAARAEIDIGRIHYDFIKHVGAASMVAMDAYKGRRTSEVTEVGAAWFIGAGGPMGQMHLQRALTRESTPKVILATDMDEGRLQMLRDRFSEQAKAREITLYIMRGDEVTKEFVHEITERRGFAHVILLAPVAKLVEEAWPYLSENGLLNVFGGVQRGTPATLRISPIYTKGCRIVGSTGSSIEDLRYVLNETEAGRLATDQIVAAIGGLGVVKDGLAGVAGGAFPGKVVIYPQLDIPLIPLPQLADCFPAVAEKLTEGRYWNREAEAALLEQCLPG